MAKADEQPSIDRARRILLKAGIYAAPIVLDVIRVKTAHAQTPSCAPFVCNPADQMCNPVTCKPRN